MSRLTSCVQIQHSPDAVSLTTLIFSLCSQSGELHPFQIIFFTYIGASSPEVDPEACEEASV